MILKITRWRTGSQWASVIKQEPAWCGRYGEPWRPNELSHSGYSGGAVDVHQRLPMLVRLPHFWRDYDVHNLFLYWWIWRGQPPPKHLRLDSPLLRSKCWWWRLPCDWLCGPIYTAAVAAASPPRHTAAICWSDWSRLKFILLAVCFAQRRRHVCTHCRRHGVYQNVDRRASLASAEPRSRRPVRRKVSLSPRPHVADDNCNDSKYTWRCRSITHKALFTVKIGSYIKEMRKTWLTN